MIVHSNIGGGQHGYLGLLVSPTAYNLLKNTPFFRQVYPGSLVIPIAATCHVQEELKRQYDENLRIFHETWGVEQTLIQKLVLVVKARYTTAMRNKTSGKFTGTLFRIIQYMIVTYGKSLQDNWSTSNRTRSQCNTIHRTWLILFSAKSKIFYNKGNWLDPCTPRSRLPIYPTQLSTGQGRSRMQLKPGIDD